MSALPEPARVACRAALAVGAQIALFTAVQTAAARLGDDVMTADIACPAALSAICSL
jgi:hypothetical protein